MYTNTFDRLLVFEPSSSLHWNFYRIAVHIHWLEVHKLFWNLVLLIAMNSSPIRFFLHYMRSLIEEYLGVIIIMTSCHINPRLSVTTSYADDSAFNIYLSMDLESDETIWEVNHLELSILSTERCRITSITSSDVHHTAEADDNKVPASLLYEKDLSATCLEMIIKKKWQIHTTARMESR